MRLRFVLLTLFMFVSSSSLGAGGHVNEREADFAFRMYNVMERDGNFVYSPFSLWSALGMAYAGAHAHTQMQMEGALSLTGEEGTLKHIVDTSKSDAFQLNISNGLWLEQTIGVLDTFQNTLRSKFGAKLHLSDFRNNSEEMRQEINREVEKTTVGKIKDLIASGGVNAQTRLVLTNGIYLKAQWTYKFEKNATQLQDFKSDKATVKAHMMHKTAQFGYVENSSFTAVEMPYVGGQFAMIAILPKDNLDSLEKTMTGKTLRHVLSSFNREDDVRLSMPKFKIESEPAVVRSLRQLGMVDAFEENAADFSNITGDKSVYIGNVIHKAIIEVDEDGTEAAAATAVVFRATALMPERRKVKEITFDKPFAYLICHKETGTVLFMGRVVNPLV